MPADQTKISSRILICEDDPGILEVITIALANAGFEPISLSDYNNIEEEIKMHKPDAVLLDRWFHGQSSEFLLENLCKTSRLRPHIILMSADSRVSEIAEKYEVDYILKPFSLDDLSKIIKRNL